MAETRMNAIKKCMRSFGPAFAGLAHLVRTQNNFRVHLLATIVVIVAGIGFQISSNEWLAIILCIAMVLGAEALNTGLELLADAVHPDQHPLIGKAKDCAAAAVLICALASVVVAAMIFAPRLL
jgi:diacylglycerol kinase